MVTNTQEMAEGAGKQEKPGRPEPFSQAQLSHKKEVVPVNWTGIVMRTAASLATLFALIALPIVLVSALSRGDLISLNGGIVVFASSLLVALILLGLIWAPRR